MNGNAKWIVGIITVLSTGFIAWTASENVENRGFRKYALEVISLKLDYLVEVQKAELKRIDDHEQRLDKLEKEK